MTSPTIDRVKIRAAVRDALVSLGHWGEKVRTVPDPQIVPPDLMHTPPFVQIFDGETDYAYSAPNQSKMVYMLGIACYADILNAQWSMEGIENEKGVTYVQDQLVLKFRRSNLGGLVDRTWVKSNSPPQLSALNVQGTNDLEVMLVAVTWLDIRVDRAG